VEHIMVIVVYICGLLAMLIELFMPGAVIGTLGFLAVAGSVVYAYLNGYSTTGTVLVLITIAYVPLFFILWKNVAGTFWANRGDEKGFKPSTSIDESLLGKEGQAMTALHPSGIATIEDKRVDVVTRGEMLDKGTHIKVIDVTGNRIVVKKS